MSNTQGLPPLNLKSILTSNIRRDSLKTNENEPSHHCGSTKEDKKYTNRTSIDFNTEVLTQRLIRSRYKSIDDIPKSIQNYIESTPSIKSRQKTRRRTISGTDNQLRKHPARFQTKETIRSHLIYQKERTFKLPAAVKKDSELFKKDKENTKFICLNSKGQQGILKKNPKVNSKKKSVQFDI